MKKGLILIVLFSIVLNLISGCGKMEINQAGSEGSGQGNSREQSRDNDPHNGTNPGNSPKSGNNTDPGKSAMPDNGPDKNNNSQPSSIPSDVYWATYSAIPDKPDSSDPIAAEGPYHAGRVEIGEPSTSEIIAAAEFSGNANCVACSNPNDHSQYWVELTQGKDGKTTGIKLSSTAANNFYLNLYLFSADGAPALNVNSLMSDSGVHAPDGSVLSDPYGDPERPIAGNKELKFIAGYRQGNEIRDAVEQAGYPTWSIRYENGMYSFGTLKETDGRARIEDIVLKPRRWKPEEGLTKGNVGVYSLSNSFTGNITFDWTFSDVPFTVKINDARLEMIDDGTDETNYTLSGTAEITITSFTYDDRTYKLNDKQKKPFSADYGFKVLKTPSPAVRWGYTESWEFADKDGAPFLLTVNFATERSAAGFKDIPVEDVDKLDGSYNMTYLMPAYGGTATWRFKPENNNASADKNSPAAGQANDGNSENQPQTPPQPEGSPSESVPDKFPIGILPLLEDAEITDTEEHLPEGGKITYNTAESIDDVFEFYKSRLQGFEGYSEQIDGDYRLMTAGPDSGYYFSVAITYDSFSGIVRVDLDAYPYIGM